MIHLAVTATEGQSAFHAPVLAPVPTDGAEQTRGFLRRWDDGGMIAGHGWGKVPDALRARISTFHDRPSAVLTDSSIKVARFFLYRRAVLMFIVDFLFGWTDGRLSDNKVCRAVPRPRRPGFSAVLSAWSGSISTSAWLDLYARTVSPESDPAKPVRSPLARPDVSSPCAQLAQGLKDLSLPVSGVQLPHLNIFLYFYDINGLTSRAPWRHFETMSNYDDR